ncbi:MAG: hypothetical protein OXF05_00620, partial [Hyphomicrobiales bacterium]|nr:hypothetical protein [Hyphomicrobiales bacterium]
PPSLKPPEPLQPLTDKPIRVILGAEIGWECGRETPKPATPTNIVEKMCIHADEAVFLKDLFCIRLMRPRNFRKT